MLLSKQGLQREVLYVHGSRIDRSILMTCVGYAALVFPGLQTLSLVIHQPVAMRRALSDGLQLTLKVKAVYVSLRRNYKVKPNFRQV